MPTGVEFDLEASTRMAQAKAIVRMTGEPEHERLFESVRHELDKLTVIYRDDEQISEHAYMALVEQADKLYFDFVKATGGVEALVRDRTRPTDRSPLRFKLVPAVGEPEGAQMNQIDREKLNRAKSIGPTIGKANPEQAAREVLRFLLTYIAVTGEFTTHPPSLITPDEHKELRDTESPTWGVTWEEGPQGWATSLSLNGPMEGDDNAFKCNTTRHGCYAEPNYSFDLFWYPVEETDGKA